MSSSRRFFVRLGLTDKQLIFLTTLVTSTGLVFLTFLHLFWFYSINEFVRCKDLAPLYNYTYTIRKKSYIIHALACLMRFMLNRLQTSSSPHALKLLDRRFLWFMQVLVNTFLTDCGTSSAEMGSFFSIRVRFNKIL